MAKLATQATISLGKKTQKIRSKFCSEIGRPCFFIHLETEVKEWLFELQDYDRLDVALKAFKAIDQQMKVGADVREVVGQVLREIRSDFGNVKEDMSSAVDDVKETMDKSIKDYLKDMVEQTEKRKEETEKLTAWNMDKSKKKPKSTQDRNTRQPIDEDDILI
jgi:hypothetical protein